MLTKEEQRRLEELTALKKNGKLNDKDFSEFKKLLGKSKNSIKDKRKDDSGFKPGNDFSWWNKIPELIKNSANFKSNYVPGNVISSRIPFMVPGVMSISLETCYNPGISPTDPVNVWARDLYLRMFQKYRPASGYSASDLGIAILAGLEAVKLIASYERIYGIINRYSRLNMNMPLVEAEALGLSGTQVTYLQTHMSDFRYDLNYLIRKAQRLCIPKDISFIADAISLFGYEYSDHDNPRGQMIMFVQEGYGIYSDTLLSSGGSIEFSGNMITDQFDFNADNMCKALDTVLNGLLGSDSIQRIYADLVVWFGQDAMLQYLPVPEDYVVVPVYSESILHKMHNLESVKPAFKLTSVIDKTLSSTDRGIVGNGLYHVYQVDDRIVTVGCYNSGGSNTPADINVGGYQCQALLSNLQAIMLDEAHIIDGYNINVDEEFIVEATLFKNSSTFITDNNMYGRLVTSSVAYIVRKMQLYDNVPNSLPTTYTSIVSSKPQAYEYAGHLALVDWAPLIYYATNDDGNTIWEVAGDLDVIVPLSRTDLSKVQRATFLSGIHTDVVPKA